MRILIDIGHPAHVHLFKNFAWIMQKKGNDVLFTCRDKEFEIDLLKSYGFKFISFGKKLDSILGKIYGLAIFDFKMLKVALEFKPDIFISHGSIYAAHASFFIRKPHIALEDTGNMEQIVLYKPFTKLILTPKVMQKKYGKKQVYYNGFHQSAFLHPNYFDRNKNYRDEFNIKSNKRIFLLRLVALNASHDINIKGLSKEKVRSLVNFLDDQGQLFISSEKPLIKEFEKFKLSISPNKIHKFLSICDLVIGESSTMSNEAGYIGVPNVFIEDTNLDVVNGYVELGLKVHYNKLNEENLEEIKSIVNNLDKIKKNIKEKSDSYINDSIDLTKFMIEIVESTIK